MDETMSKSGFIANVIFRVHRKSWLKGRTRMKTKTLAVCVFVLLTSVYFMSISTAFADIGEGDWITEFKVENLDTNQVIMQRNFLTGTNDDFGSIAEGADLKISVTVEIGVSNPAATLQLSTEMAHSSSEDRYWQLVSQDYQMSSNYNPNSKAVTFKQEKGTLEIICYGSIPEGIVKKTIQGITLHTPFPMALIELSVPGGEVLDNIQENVTDAKSDQYLNLLQGKLDKLQSLRGSGVDPGYVQVFENVVAQAQAMGDAGFSDNAIALLQGLDVASEPAGSLMQGLFLPLIVVFAVIAVLFGFLFMRNRGKVSYYRLVIEDQIKDLEGLTLRASKIDRTISSNLASIEDRLKRLVGM
jgi:hypothetical protein